MSGKRESNASNRAKKKPKSIKDALLASSEQIHKSLQAQHKGKRLLLTAMSIYHSKSKIPEGEENFIFLYRVAEINPGGSTSKRVTQTSGAILLSMIPICLLRTIGLPSSRKTTNPTTRFVDQSTGE